MRATREGRDDGAVDAKVEAPAGRTARPADAAAQHAILAQIHAGAGNAQVQRLIAGQRAGAAGGARGAPLQRKARSSTARREAASELGAADARSVLLQQVPLLMPNLTQEQIEQLQTVIDASAINPGVRERLAEAEQKATKQYGSLTVRDEKLGRAADRVGEELVPIGANDKRIHLDAKPLLYPELFTPKTDNPDEAAFLDGVRGYLERNGVWLLMGDGLDPEVWLSLGPVADGSKTIPTVLGGLTQDSLLNTQLLGANFYEQVDRGPVSRGFDREANRLFDRIENGRAEHFERGRIRDDAFPGVVEVSDWAGDADFPDIGIWDPPFELLIKARNEWNAGHTVQAFASLVASARIAKTAATVLSTYAEKTEEGARIAVKWLERAKTAGKVAETALLIMSGVGIVAGGGRLAAGAVATEIDVLAERELASYAARNPFLRSAETVEVVESGVRGQTLRGTSYGGEGWHKGWGL